MNIINKTFYDEWCSSISLGLVWSQKIYQKLSKEGM